MDSQDVVLKPTGTIQIVNRFSLVERKLLNGLVWHAQQSGELTADEKVINLRDVLVITGLTGTRNRKIIQDALKALISTIIEWNYFHTDRTFEWGACSFLSSGKIISGGKVKYRLNPELVEQINRPTLFAKMALLVQSQFRRRNALVLYEFMIDTVCRKRARQIRIEKVPLEQIHVLLDITEDKQREQFKFFNRDVLKPCIAEINDFSDIHVEYEGVRSGRRIAFITFNIALKSAFPIPLLQSAETARLQGKDVLEVLEETSSLSISVAEPKRSRSVSRQQPPSEPGRRKGSTKRRSAIQRTEAAERAEPREALFAGTEGPPVQSGDDTIRRLKVMGINGDKAAHLTEAFGPLRIRANLDLVYAKISAGQAPKNLAAFLIKAIEEDYAGGTVEAPQVQQRVRCRKAQEEMEQRLHQQQQEAWKKFRAQRLEEKFRAQSAEWKERRKEEMRRRLEEENNTWLLDIYNAKGATSSQVHRYLLCMVRDELLTEDVETDFNAFRDFQARYSLNLEG